VKLAAIVMGRKMKTSARGRFAFVQLSDASSMFEASIFDETVLDTRRDLLETGTLVYLTAEAKVEETGARIIIQNIQKLEEALTSSPVHTHTTDLCLRIAHADAVSTLKRLLPSPTGKGTRITLRATIDNGQAAIVTLPNRYNLSAEALLGLRAMQGLEVLA
jgi:DNA polymerase-3 subunit alpha